MRTFWGTLWLVLTPVSRVRVGVRVGVSWDVRVWKKVHTRIEVQGCV